MSSTSLTDGRVLHIPGAPFIVDSISVIEAPAGADLAGYVPLIREPELLPFVARLVRGCHKRRRQDRYRKVNLARLELARLCIDRAAAALNGGAVDAGL